MKHLEPAPQSGSRPPLPRKTPVRRSGITLVLAGLALVAGLGFGMSQLWGVPAHDDVADARKQELVRQFLKMGPAPLTPVADADLDQALAGMKLAPDQARTLRQALTNAQDATPGQPTLQLAWLEIWDFAEQDGDVVHVSTAGYEMDVPMLSARTRVAVPVDAGKALVLTGVSDGGGGITLGVMTSTGATQLPVLAPGQSLTLPVAL